MLIGSHADADINDIICYSCNWTSIQRSINRSSEDIQDSVCYQL